MIHYLSRLQNATRQYWDKAALNNFQGESISYGQMATRIEKFHIFFESIGVQKGDRIALCSRNGTRFGMSYLSVNTYEAVIVPILFDFTAESVNNLVDHSESVGLFTNADKWSTLDIAKMPAVRFVVDVDTWDLLYSADQSVADAYAAVEAKFAEKYPEGFGPENVVYPVDNLDNLSTINYTSGTTSAPKGVMLTYGNFSSNVDFAQTHIPSSDKFKMVSMLPMAHMYGLVIEFIYPLCNGTAIYWLGKTPTPSLLLKAFAEVKPYLLVTVPLVMEKIVKSKVFPIINKPVMKVLCKIPVVNKFIYKTIRQQLEEAFGGQVQEFIMGGAALNPEVEALLQKIDFPYVVGYGMTEAAPLLAYEHHCDFVPGSCGKAVDGSIVRIDSADPQHIAGEIQAKGPNVCLGYYKNPEASANAFTDDGFLRTGDLGIIDAAGNIFIKGRSKSMILGPSGQNIYPEEIEAVVNNEQYVVESVVVDRDHKLVALVYFDQAAMEKDGLSDADMQAVSDRIRKHSNKQLPNYSQITKIERVDKPFEKTPKMSIKRFMYS